MVGKSQGSPLEHLPVHCHQWTMIIGCWGLGKEYYNIHAPTTRTKLGRLGGLDWWTDTKNYFYVSNETYLPIGLYDASY